MNKKIVVVNAGPRKGWNTETLVTEAGKGAQEAGATVERFDLFRLEKYTGCISDAGAGRHSGVGRADHRLSELPVRNDGILPGAV